MDYDREHDGEDELQAARSSREATLRQQSKNIRADIARLQGQSVPALPLENRLEKYAFTVCHIRSITPFTLSHHVL